MKWFQTYKLLIVGVLLGAVGGYAYYYFIGCESGGCAITSKPLNSVLYGSLMGGLALNIFRKESGKKENPGTEEQ
ncbi:MAG: DUF6132 family protein [Flavobacteriales bacterium]|nr:DUF6132 family protein [Flavobacteriales bacterium]